MSGEMKELLGSLDGLDGNGQLSGWAWSPDEPSVRRTLWLYANEMKVGTTTADRPRPDLAAQGFGDGFSGFAFPVPQHDAPTEYSVRDVATGEKILGSIVLGGEAAAVLNPPLEVAGSLDEISGDGWLSGWCWYPGDPGRRASVKLYVDDVPVGVAIAAEARSDLKAAGIGDGRHGFMFALPAATLLHRGEIVVTARDLHSNELFGSPIVKRLGQLAPIEERIAMLERQLRMARAEIEGYARQAMGRDEHSAARELFRTVGSFFEKLAEGPALDGFPGAALRATVAEFSSRFTPLALAFPDRIDATIVVSAASPASVVYECLTSLHATGADRRAEVVLIDDGSRGAEMALLPTVIRNFRYHHVPPGGSVARAQNDIAASARGATVVFLDSDLRATEGWLENLLVTFDEQPDAGLIGCRVLRRDGMVDDAGIVLDDSLLPRRLGRAESAAAAAFRFMRPVDAVSHQGFAVRRGAIPRAALFDELYSTAAAAAIDLSIAARQAGRQVLHQPASRLERAGESQRDERQDRNDFVRLQRSWSGRETQAAGFVGRILVVDAETPAHHARPEASGLFEHMQALRRLGWRVTFTTVDGRPGDGRLGEFGDVADLERTGIEVAGAPSFAAPFDLLRSAGPEFAFVYLNGLASASDLMDRARSHAPQAKIIYDPAAPQFIAELRQAASRASKRRPQRSAAWTAEMAAIGGADVVISASGVEHDALATEAAGGNLRVMRPAFEISKAPPAFQSRGGIAFVGDLRDASCIDAIAWFMAEVFPLIRQVAPAMEIAIAGANPPQALGNLVGHGVVLTERDASIADALDGARVSISPRRFIGGLCREIPASLARGVPIVCTEQAIEGSGLASGHGVTIAKDAVAFARAVIRLHSIEPDWADQASRGLEAVRKLYEPQAAQTAWRDLLDSLAP